jgi:hypothetical protein
MNNTEYSSNGNTPPRRTAMLITIALLAVNFCSAATNTWTGAATPDMKWSTTNNWSGGVPGVSDDVEFDTGGAAGGAGIVNNVVDASLSIQSLAYKNTNTFHTTQIDPGATLTVTGSVAKAMLVGTDTDAGGSVNVSATVLGSTLVITNSSGVLTVRQGSTSGSPSTHRATLDMSGLTNFTAYVSRFLVAGDAVQNNPTSLLRESGTLYLAQTNFIVCSASSSTPGLGISDGPGFASSGVVYLGQTNTNLCRWRDF